ncbi:PREDICTED: ribonuclease H1 [Dufourea novaeangliae]|uniref:ribonuclease H1 n=1 Tax=Dufourea novaeangliae TaxID=178035 RepID=UPI00076758EC|nr:PREDICTED: ribonuclease H1 [Dufourea novaeangliae]
MFINPIYRFFNTCRMAPSYYAVAKGRNPGIYNTWDECKAQVHQFTGPLFKKFQTKQEAENFIGQNPNSSTLNNRTGISGTRKRSQSLRNTVIKKQFPTKKRKIMVLDTVPSTASTEQNIVSSDFTIDIDGYVNVYTDGACSSNGGPNAKAGIGVWFGDDHPLNVSRPVVGRATNNMAEIQAVTVAARITKQAGIKNIKIITDSKFLIRCINEWMPKWKTNGWKTVGNKSVINKVELLEMEDALKSLNVVWKHVNGHIGVYGNEMADKLARAGCAQY